MGGPCVDSLDADGTVKRRCGKCRRRKVLDDFHRSSHYRLGRQPWCKKCMCRVMRKIQRAKAAELRAFRLMRDMVDAAIEESK